MIRFGTHRIVFLIGPYAIKVPRIYIGGFLGWLWRNHEQCRLLRYAIRAYLLDGILEQYREARCWRNTHHRLLARCRLGLIFCNVYDRHNPSESFAGPSIYQTMQERTHRDAKLMFLVEHLGHTIDSVDNFAITGNAPIILDYGNPFMDQLLTEYGGFIEEVLCIRLGL
ncbi:MAG: hypothetical protein ABIG71_04145 [Candidatus Uhrbacteria bacterium]